MPEDGGHQMVSADIAGEERVAKKEWRVQQHSSIAQAWEALQMTRSREKALEESMVTLENQLGVLNGVLVAQGEEIGLLIEESASTTVTTSSAASAAETSVSTPAATPVAVAVPHVAYVQQSTPPNLEHAFARPPEAEESERSRSSLLRRSTSPCSTGSISPSHGIVRAAHVLVEQWRAEGAYVDAPERVERYPTDSGLGQARGATHASSKGIDAAALQQMQTQVAALRLQGKWEGLERDPDAATPEENEADCKGDAQRDDQEASCVKAAFTRSAPEMTAEEKRKAQEDYHAFFAEFRAHKPDKDAVSQRANVECGRGTTLQDAGAMHVECGSGTTLQDAGAMHSKRSLVQRIPAEPSGDQAVSDTKKVRRLMQGNTPISCELTTEEQTTIVIPENHSVCNGFVEKVAIGSNAVYTGQFESGKRHGKGMTRYADGSSFTGDYLNDLKHGWGEQVFLSGHTYRGQFEDDRLHGVGTLTWSDGRVHKGNWFRGNIEGKGTHEWPDGQVFEGTFLNDAPIKGILTAPNGERRKLLFDEGCQGIWFGVLPEPMRVYQMKASTGSGIGSWLKQVFRRQDTTPTSSPTKTPAGSPMAFDLRGTSKSPQKKPFAFRSAQSSPPSSPQCARTKHEESPAKKIRDARKVERKADREERKNWDQGLEAKLFA